MSQPYEKHRAQIELILRAWGMVPAHAATTADVLAYADLCGIDSHGMSMLPPYDKLRRAGLLDIGAEPKVTKETPVSAVVDAGGGLGHPAGRLAMQTAISKAKAIGMATVVVRNTAHYGACGWYTKMAAEAGHFDFDATHLTHSRSHYFSPPTRRFRRDYRGQSRRVQFPD